MATSLSINTTQEYLDQDTFTKKHGVWLSIFSEGLLDDVNVELQTIPTVTIT